MKNSCPTREPGGGNFALHERPHLRIVRRVREAHHKPLWAKLSPNAGEIDLVAARRGAGRPDALTISNTCRAQDQTPRLSSPPMIGNGYGGISGPGIKPIILRMVHQCRRRSDPDHRAGGIVKVEDVVEYMLAGASAVMIGYLTSAIPPHDRHHRRARGLVPEARLPRVADLTGAMKFDKPAATLVAAAAPIG